MNQRGDSRKKNVSRVALAPRNNESCWLLSHTARCDVTHKLLQNASRAGKRAFLEQRTGQHNLAAQTSGRLFSVRRARNGRKPVRRRANKTSPVAVAKLMSRPERAGYAMARFPGLSGFKTGTRFARDFSLRWISSSSRPVWSSSRSSARCGSACWRATRPARGRRGRTPGIAARAAPSS